MLNVRNLNKSITNDKNLIAFLKAYRDRARQELAQPYHIDFRAGGPFNREISRGYCGTLAVEAEVLTPIHIRESGELSFTITLDGSPVNGWDFFAMASPEAAQRGPNKVYALPSRSIRGTLRHIYFIASDSREPSPDISRLNPVDRGYNRYLGFGSLRLHVLPASFLIDWAKRYAGKPEQEWRLPIQVDEWIEPGVIYPLQGTAKGIKC
jgi:hypothetical protein